MYRFQHRLFPHRLFPHQLWRCTIATGALHDRSFIHFSSMVLSFLLAAVPIAVENIPVGLPGLAVGLPTAPLLSPAPRSVPVPVSVPPQSMPPSFDTRSFDTRWIYPLANAVPVISKFGWRIHPIYGDRRFHAGVDLEAAAGTQVLATTAARVKSAGRLGGYGLAVVLAHDDGLTNTLYGHLSEILVGTGQIVQPGQVIGKVGSTGRSTGPHLHFEVRRWQAGDWVAVDPGPIGQ
jgi:murein DD-endopeptidase MepM/ murein hydrolase activator NlpD